MAFYILFLVVVFSGFLVRLEKNKRFNFLKAFLMVIGEGVIGTTLFLLFIFIINKTFLNGVLISGVNSLFGLLLLIAVINGIIL